MYFQEKKCYFLLALVEKQPMKLLFFVVVLQSLIVSNSLQPQGLHHTKVPCPLSYLEFALIHVHWIGNVILPSHPLPPLSFFAFKLSPIRVYSHESDLLIRWTNYWSFSISPSNEYSGLISFRIDWFDLLHSKGSKESSPAPQFKSSNSSALSILCGPTVTSVCDYWKNHSFD